MNAFEKLSTQFRDRFYLLDEAAIYRLNELNSSAEINNVIVGRRKECFGLAVKDDSVETLSWGIFYLSGEGILKGALLELEIGGADNCELVMMFSKYLTQQFTGLDLLDTYNTFQDHTMSMLERLGFFTVSKESLENLNDPNPVVIAKNVRGIIPIRTIRKESFYKDFFNSVVKGSENEPKVYLLLNPTANHVKIGRSKRPRYREKTLQSQEPHIYLIASWIAPRSVETFLHNKFREKRLRGEWFKLNFNDLAEIKEHMDSLLSPNQEGRGPSTDS